MSRFLRFDAGDGGNGGDEYYEAKPYEPAHDERESGITAKGFDTDLTFMAAEITGDEMYFNVVSRAGQILDSGVLTRRTITP